jgi:hypothetical protein
MYKEELQRLLSLCKSIKENRAPGEFDLEGNKVLYIVRGGDLNPAILAAFRKHMFVLFWRGVELARTEEAMCGDYSADKWVVSPPKHEYLAARPTTLRETWQKVGDDFALLPLKFESLDGTVHESPYCALHFPVKGCFTGTYNAPDWLVQVVECDTENDIQTLGAAFESIALGNRVPTTNRFQVFLNPEMEVNEETFQRQKDYKKVQLDVFQDPQTNEFYCHEPRRSTRSNFTDVAAKPSCAATIRAAAQIPTPHST